MLIQSIFKQLQYNAQNFNMKTAEKKEKAVRIIISWVVQEVIRHKTRNMAAKNKAKEAIWHKSFKKLNEQVDRMHAT